MELRSRAFQSLSLVESSQVADSSTGMHDALTRSVCRVDHRTSLVECVASGVLASATAYTSSVVPFRPITGAHVTSGHVFGNEDSTLYSAPVGTDPVVIPSDVPAPPFSPHNRSQRDRLSGEETLEDEGGTNSTVEAPVPLSPLLRPPVVHPGGCVAWTPSRLTAIGGPFLPFRLSWRVCMVSRQSLKRDRPLRGLVEALSTPVRRCASKTFHCAGLSCAASSDEQRKNADERDVNREPCCSIAFGPICLGAVQGQCDPSRDGDG